jgi:hypothetical protein
MGLKNSWMAFSRVATPPRKSVAAWALAASLISICWAWLASVTAWS